MCVCVCVFQMIIRIYVERREYDDYSTLLSKVNARVRIMVYYILLSATRQHLAFNAGADRTRETRNISVSIAVC